MPYPSALSLSQKRRTAAFCLHMKPTLENVRDLVPPVLTQHIGISRDAFGYVGALLAGEELDSTRPI
jgi:hypothetical protein